MTFPLDITTELFIDGGWVDVSADVRYKSGITIERGRPDEFSRVPPSRCALVINNRDGTYSPRNPTSPYYGLIGRNTPLRVYLGTPHLGDGGGSATASTSHVAPSVTATEGGLLMCAWLSGGVGNYTTPGGMTAGTERDGAISTSQTGRQSVSSGATGTRTATFSVSEEYASASVVAHGTSVTVQESLSSVADTAHVTLTTGSGTQAGWWLVAVQGWARNLTLSPEATDDMPDTPSGDQGGWVPLADSGLIEIGTTRTLRVKAWARRVNIAGAQQVIFRQTSVNLVDVDNHARVFVLSSVGDWDLRLYGEVPSWPSRWNVAGTDVFVPITAAGILRRLEQGAAPLRSALARGIPRLETPAALAYWPMEDGANATVAASGLVGGRAMATTGMVEWASMDVANGSAPLPNLRESTGTITGPISGTTAAAWNVGFLLSYTDTTSWLAVTIDCKEGGRFDQVRITFSNAVLIQGVDSGGTTTIINNATDLSDGERHWFEMRAVDTGAPGVSYQLYLDGSFITTGTFGTGNSPATSVQIHSRTSGAAAAIGHLTVWSDGNANHHPAVVTIVDGNTGETAGRRIERLCHEENIALHGVGDLDDTEHVGPQRIGTFLDLLRDAETVDGGVLYEPREQLGLAYRTRTSTYNQTATLGLTYGAAGEVAPPLEPQEDDRYLRNDVTVSRRDGSSERAVLAAGPLSTLDPPDGVGLYDEQVTLNAETDEQLPNIAAWKVHLGTWDEARYPVVRINQRALDKVGKTTLLRAAAAGDVRQRLTIDDPPAWLPPDQIHVIVESCTETLAPHAWDIEFDCSPAGPWMVGEYDTARYGTAGSTLNGAHTSTATSLSVATTLGPLWTTTDEPFDVNIGGERVTVTAVTGASSPQTFTVTRSVNGVVKAQSSGTAVKLWQPAYYAL